MAKLLKALVALSALAAMCSTPALAAVLEVEGGILRGARGVDVAGKVYDIMFADGICTDLFDGCDSATDFNFQNETDAIAAARALLDSVLVDGPLGDFDSNPAAVFGCQAFKCSIFTPFARVNVTDVPSADALNWSEEANDVIRGYTVPSTFDSATSPYHAWAIWTPSFVPEPATLALVGVALAGLAATRRLRVMPAPSSSAQRA